MTSSRTEAMEPDEAMLEAAAAWRVRISSEEEQPDDAVADAFGHWLAADPKHAEAFDRTTAAWDLLEGQAAAPEVIRARRDALDFLRRSARRRWRDEPSRRTVFGLAASAAAVAVLGAVAWPMLDGVEVYRTRKGERRQVTLADGSIVALDSSTRVRVRYTDAARRLTLERGQARFDVAHNPARPFSVTAGDRSVVATGTAFNIDMLGRDVHVTLIEGSVIVKPAATAAPSPLSRPVTLKSGQQLVAVAGSPAVTIRPVKTDDAVAWQSGKLIFVNAQLAQAVMRVNRYADRPIVIDDPAVAGLHVSGVFKTGDADTFARAMAQYLGLQAVFSDGKISLSARPTT